MMETGYVLQVKNIRIKAYIGDKATPITNGSVSMSPSGYRFSIGIPPSKLSISMKYGSYGRIYYSDGSDGGGWYLLCDGYLINDSLTANRGVFIRQLIFADCNDALRFFYIDDNILNAANPSSGKKAPIEKQSEPTVNNVVAPKKWKGTEIKEIIEAAAKAKGLDANWMKKIASMETIPPFNPYSVNGTSSGLFGFLDGTFVEMGGRSGEEMDPAQSAKAAANYMVFNMAKIKGVKPTGYKPTLMDVYAMHMLGSTGGADLLKARDTELIGNVVGANAIASNLNAFKNIDTVGDFKTYLKKRLDQTSMTFPEIASKVMPKSSRSTSASTYDTMFNQLKDEGGIDIIGRGDMADMGNFAQTLSKFVNLKADTQMMAGEQKSSEGIKSVVGIATANMLMMAKDPSFLGEPAPLFDYLFKLMSKSKNSARYLLFDRWFHAAELMSLLHYTKGAQIITAPGVLEMALNWMYGSTGVTDFASMMNKALGICMMQTIVVPGRINNQVLMLPDTPFLPEIPKYNSISDHYESISITFGGDIPCSTSVVAANEFRMGAGEGLETNSQVFGFAGGAESIFYKNTYIHKLDHEYFNLAAKIFNCTGTKDSDYYTKDEMRGALDSMARYSLARNVARNNTITINSDYAHFGIVPGFAMKVNVGGYPEMYGKVEQVNIYFEHKNVTTSIVLSNVLNTKDPKDNPYLRMGDYDIEYMNMYEKEGVGLMMKYYQNDLSINRHAVAEGIGGNTIDGILNQGDDYGAEIKNIIAGMGDVFYSTKQLKYGDSNERKS